jgi:predicted DCC family thiol-disulfide oxidoreductase YuxK
MSGQTTAPSLVLYDGVCGFCDAGVRWLLAHDECGRFRFAPLQGAAAAALRERHPEIGDSLDSMAYVDSSGGRERVHLRSEAVFCILAELDRPWRWVAFLRWLPRPLTDLGYDIFARLRYRVFGRLDECRVPTPTERQRFLA